MLERGLWEARKKEGPIFVNEMVPRARGEVMIGEVEIAPIVGVEVLRCEGRSTKMMRWDEKRKNKFRRALL